MKRGKLFLAFIIVAMLVMSAVSANVFSDFWGKITGEATSGTASLNITVGNSVPTISFVTALAAQNATESGTTNVVFNFSVNDTDGSGNINTSGARAQLNRTGESTRSNSSCINIGSGGNGLMFKCTVGMLYFDENAVWTINVSARDNNDAGAENSTTNFTYNLLTAMAISPAALTWTGIGLSSTDAGSNNDPMTINNTGNAANGTINTTAYNLRGETTTTQFIFANNFTVGNATEGCTLGAGTTTMANATSRQLNGTNFTKGNNSLNFGNQTSGQEQTFFCLKGVPQDASAQSYSSAFYGPWVIQVIV